MFANCDIVVDEIWFKPGKPPLETVIGKEQGGIFMLTPTFEKPFAERGGTHPFWTKGYRGGN